MEQININDFEGVFEIMDQSFPQDERRKKEEQRALFSVPEYKVFVRREGGKIIAFIAVWEFERFLYVEHFAVSPKKRGGVSLIERAYSYGEFSLPSAGSNPNNNVG